MGFPSEWSVLCYALEEEVLGNFSICSSTFRSTNETLLQAEKADLPKHGVIHTVSVSPSGLGIKMP